MQLLQLLGKRFFGTVGRLLADHNTLSQACPNILNSLEAISSASC